MKLVEFYTRITELNEVVLSDIISYKGNDAYIPKNRLSLWVKSANKRYGSNERRILIFFRKFNTELDSHCHRLYLKMESNNSVHSIVEDPRHSIDDHNITEEAALAVSLRLLQEIQPYDYITKMMSYEEHMDYYFKPVDCAYVDSIEMSGTTIKDGFESRTKEKLNRFLANSNQGFISISYFSEVCSHRFVRVL